MLTYILFITWELTLFDGEWQVWPVFTLSTFVYLKSRPHIFITQVLYTGGIHITEKTDFNLISFISLDIPLPRPILPKHDLTETRFNQKQKKKTFRTASIMRNQIRAVDFQDPGFIGFKKLSNQQQEQY